MISTVCGAIVIGVYGLAVGILLYRAFRRERRDLRPYLLSLSPEQRKRAIQAIVATL